LVQAKAFEHLNKLKWVRLGINNLQTLPYQFFKTNPNLIFIGLYGNKINSIYPSFFDGLLYLKYIHLEKNLCIETSVGCKDCEVIQTDIKNQLQNCFDKCSPDTICELLYKTSKPVENDAESLAVKIETGLELVRNATKHAIEVNNQKIQEVMETKLKNMENQLKDFLKQEFDELEKKLMAIN
jgi:hypothetical protein